MSTHKLLETPVATHKLAVFAAALAVFVAACVEPPLAVDDAEIDIAEMDYPVYHIDGVVEKASDIERLNAVPSTSDIYKLRVIRDASGMVWFKYNGVDSVGFTPPPVQDAWYCVGLNGTTLACSFIPSDPAGEGELQFSLAESPSKACTLLPTKGKKPLPLEFATHKNDTACKTSNGSADRCFRVQRTGYAGVPLLTNSVYHIACL